MKKLVILFFSSILLVGCTTNESGNNELTKLKKELTQLKVEKEQLQNNNVELKQKLDEYEENTSIENPNDRYSLTLNSTLNTTLHFIEALNKNELESVEGILSSHAKLDLIDKKIVFTQNEVEQTIDLNLYTFPLEDFNFRGAGFGSDNQTFLLFFSFVGGEGETIYNIETELHFIFENNEWKLDLLQS